MLSLRAIARRDIARLVKGVLVNGKEIVVYMSVSSLVFLIVFLVFSSLTALN
jgi:hypothetical protein